MRSVEEWIAEHDDQRVPDRVRARIFIAYDGICYLSKRKIRPGESWELEHIVALCNGGKHKESNLAPALVDPHKAKTKKDRKLKSYTDRIRKHHLGIRKKQSRPMPGTRASGIRKRMNGKVERWSG